MPVTLFVGKHKVTAWRDTGYSSVVVKEKFVQKDQYIGTYGYMLTADTTLRGAPLVKIKINIPYYVGEVEPAYLPEALYVILRKRMSPMISTHRGGWQTKKNPERPSI